MNSPYIIEETQDFAVVYKPPKMHTTGKKQDFNCESNENETLFEWYKNQSCNNQYIKLLHRLDFETQGIILLAKNEKCYNFLKKAQDENEFVKEYSAVCQSAAHDDSSYHAPHSMLRGFPEPPSFFSESLSREKPFIIESYFRPFGPGRKCVRPVIEDGKKHKETAKDRGGFYKTEIININGNIIKARIKRGFRHQIRCHLCWAGCPVLNDPLYSGETRNFSEEILALRASAVFFPDPQSKNAKKLEFHLSPFK